MDDELRVLRAVQLRLPGRADQVATATGQPDDAVARRLAGLVDRGLVVDTAQGWRLTPDGRARLDALLEAEGATIDGSAAAALHERSLVLDRTLDELVAAHQVAGADPDACCAAAADVAARLEDLHHWVAPLVDDAAALVARLEPYRARLAGAVREVTGGDTRYVAHPLVDSYRTVWSDLHEELRHLGA